MIKADNVIGTVCETMHDPAYGVTVVLDCVDAEGSPIFVGCSMSYLGIGSLPQRVRRFAELKASDIVSVHGQECISRGGYMRYRNAGTGKQETRDYRHVKVSRFKRIHKATS